MGRKTLLSCQALEAEEEEEKLRLLPRPPSAVERSISLAAGRPLRPPRPRQPQSLVRAPYSPFFNSLSIRSSSRMEPFGSVSLLRFFFFRIWEIRSHQPNPKTGRTRRWRRRRGKRISGHPSSSFSLFCRGNTFCHFLFLLLPPTGNASFFLSSTKTKGNNWREEGKEGWIPVFLFPFPLSAPDCSKSIRDPRRRHGEKTRLRRPREEVGT